LSVLVIDDCKDTVNSCTLMLEIWGYLVHTAHDGQEALDTARACRPDVVLLDIGLPRASGWEAARRLREECGLGGALVVISGDGREADVQRSKEAGINIHLLKPADPDELRQLLVATEAARPPG
jgi:CheY-like chemotaxis protein